MKNILAGICLASALCAPSAAGAALYNFFWTGDPALDATISGGGAVGLQAVGTVDINAGPGEAFLLADILSTDITVSGGGITAFTFTNWNSAAGSISADGLTATFTPAGNPFYFDGVTDGSGTPIGDYFGCRFLNCGLGFPGFFTVLARGGTEVVVDYGSAEAATASMTMNLVPLPAALPLLATALGALGAVGHWRRRRNRA